MPSIEGISIINKEQNLLTFAHLKEIFEITFLLIWEWIEIQ